MRGRILHQAAGANGIETGAQTDGPKLRGADDQMVGETLAVDLAQIQFFRRFAVRPQAFVLWLGADDEQAHRHD